MDIFDVILHTLQLLVLYY